ncbi:MAG TPA: hypothetical protein VKA13_00135, partial [Gammaproteobacteria bacterium]|nr:hypothetical protein [Gammaproteobacteria bacterium]
GQAHGLRLYFASPRPAPLAEGFFFKGRATQRHARGQHIHYSSAEGRLILFPLLSEKDNA